MLKEEWSKQRKAQKIFSALIETSTAVDEKDIVKTDEYEKLKMIYPNASDEMIFQVIDFMK